jgi:CBS domain-containing protein
MRPASAPAASPVLFLNGKTAQDLMTPSDLTIAGTATLEEAVSLLMDHNMNAVPVRNEKGEPVGVLSRSDVVAHDRDAYEFLHHRPQQTEEGGAPPLRMSPESDGNAVAKEKTDPLVQDIMTKVIYWVAPGTPAKTVIDAMLALGVHQLFVTECGALLGVISSINVLRHLHEPLTVSFEQVELLDTTAIR